MQDATSECKKCLTSVLCLVLAVDKPLSTEVNEHGGVCSFENVVSGAFLTFSLLIMYFFMFNSERVSIRGRYIYETVQVFPV